MDALLAGSASDPIRRALWLDALDLRLKPHLPPPLDAHARLANIDGDTLVFLVDSPVWHTRLRLAAPQLLTAARSLGLAATQLTIKIRVDSASRSDAYATSASSSLVPISARPALEAALASLQTPDHGIQGKRRK